MQTILTGVKPTHKPHLGNFTGAIRPTIEASNQPNTQTWMFLADYHSLTTVHDPKLLQEMIIEVAATYLACGMDPKKTIFYRQSDVPEIMELSWVLSCFTSKGLMNRAHAYKARVQENQEHGKDDLDFGVNMGLFNYPVLMSADILMFSAAKVPVGEDQVQHLEIARDIAQKFNRTYAGEILKVPEVVVQKNGKSIPGLDGRKMSKSYGNHIPLFEEPKALKKLIAKIKTDSLPPETSRSTDGSVLFEIYQAFSTPEQAEAMRAKYAKGTGWGYIKEDLFQLLDEQLSEPRRVYQELMKDQTYIKTQLREGAAKARPQAQALLKKVRTAIGIEL
jgi:tryptophanyl-tRNA synthetase